MTEYDMWEKMTEAQRDAWRRGHSAGMGFGLYGTPAINPYDTDEPLYSFWAMGARQGYQDS